MTTAARIGGALSGGKKRGKRQPKRKKPRLTLLYTHCSPDPGDWTGAPARTPPSSDSECEDVSTATNCFAPIIGGTVSGLPRDPVADRRFAAAKAVFASKNQRTSSRTRQRLAGDRIGLTAAGRMLKRKKKTTTAATAAREYRKGRTKAIGSGYAPQRQHQFGVNRATTNPPMAKSKKNSSSTRDFGKGFNTIASQLQKQMMSKVPATLRSRKTGSNGRRLLSKAPPKAEGIGAANGRPLHAHSTKAKRRVKDKRNGAKETVSALSAAATLLSMSASKAFSKRVTTTAPAPLENPSKTSRGSATAVAPEFEALADSDRSAIASTITTPSLSTTEPSSLPFTVSDLDSLSSTKSPMCAPKTPQMSQCMGQVTVSLSPAQYQTPYGGGVTLGRDDTCVSFGRRYELDRYKESHYEAVNSVRLVLAPESPLPMALAMHTETPAPTKATRRRSRIEIAGETVAGKLVDGSAHDYATIGSQQASEDSMSGRSSSGSAGGSFYPSEKQARAAKMPPPFSLEAADTSTPATLCLSPRRKAREKVFRNEPMVITQKTAWPQRTATAICPANLDAEDPFMKPVKQKSKSRKVKKQKRKKKRKSKRSRKGKKSGFPPGFSSESAASCSVSSSARLPPASVSSVLTPPTLELSPAVAALDLGTDPQQYSFEFETETPQLPSSSRPLADTCEELDDSFVIPTPSSGMLFSLNDLEEDSEEAKSAVDTLSTQPSAIDYFLGNCCDEVDFNKSFTVLTPLTDADIWRVQKDEDLFFDAIDAESQTDEHLLSPLPPLLNTSVFTDITHVSSPQPWDSAQEFIDPFVTPLSEFQLASFESSSKPLSGDLMSPTNSDEDSETAKWQLDEDCERKEISESECEDSDEFRKGNAFSVDNLAMIDLAMAALGSEDDADVDDSDSEVEYVAEGRSQRKSVDDYFGPVIDGKKKKSKRRRSIVQNTYLNDNKQNVLELVEAATAGEHMAEAAFSYHTPLPMADTRLALPLPREAFQFGNYPNAAFACFEQMPVAGCGYNQQFVEGMYPFNTAAHMQPAAY